MEYVEKKKKRKERNEKEICQLESYVLRETENYSFSEHITCAIA